MSGLVLRTNIITLGAFRKLLMRYRSKKWFRGALQNLEKSVGQHLCQSFFFKKIAGLQPTPLLKKKFWHRWLSINFTIFFKTGFYAKYIWATALIWKSNLSNRLCFFSKLSHKSWLFISIFPQRVFFLNVFLYVLKQQ